MCAATLCYYREVQTLARSRPFCTYPAMRTLASESKPFRTFLRDARYEIDLFRAEGAVD